MSLGKYLKQVRKLNKKTLEIVARDTEISIGYLHKIETEKQKRPKIWALQKLAAYYGIGDNDLIIRAGKIPPVEYHKVVRCPELLEVIRNHRED